MAHGAVEGDAASGAATGAAPCRRLVELPDRGRLIVGTDLQGNLKDFRRLASVFRRACDEHGEAHLVVTGDLVHGPEIPPHHWPDYLGTFYQADSVGVVDLARELADEHPGRVHYLLGNHEHAHIGGPVVSKFFPNEAARLDGLLGEDRADDFRRWLRSWPLVATARKARLLMLHGAPNAVLSDPSELDEVCVDAGVGVVDELLAELLWARTASTARARAFLRVFDPELTVALYGHDVAREGFAIDREPLLCLSTSFGCIDGDKLYLSWDLAEPIGSAADVAARGLWPLWPDAAPVYRDVSSVALDPTVPAPPRPRSDSKAP